MRNSIAFALIALAVLLPAPSADAGCPSQMWCQCYCDHYTCNFGGSACQVCTLVGEAGCGSWSDCHCCFFFASSF